jgi:acetyl-CoA carboxylase carboxyltransferase component
MDKREIEALLAAKTQRRDAARPDIVTRIHDSAKLTARERIEAVLDPGSEVEYGAIAAQGADGDWIAEAGGVDFVGTMGGHPVIVSSTDYTDHGGGYGAGRLGRLFALAYEQRWPVVLFVDGGGSRARHPRAGLGHVETSGPIGRFSFLDGIPELSGWVPSVAIVSGPAFAGHASIAGFSDFLISTPGSSIGMGGPPMVEAALGQRLSANELAGSEMHETTGGIDLLVADEAQAIAAAKRFLHYFHEPQVEARDAPADADLDELATADRYDMHDVIDALCDQGSVFELRPRFAQSLITALARIGGKSVGVIANQPVVADGAIDHDGATKIARFVELCNAYEYPIVALVDTPGCTAKWQDKKDEVTVEPGLTRWHARAVIAHQQRTVPLVSVQIRRGRGFAPALMTGVSSTRGVPLMKLAWPGVEIGRRDGFSAGLDHNAFDDVIAPGQTRERLVRAFKLLRAPARGADPSQHRKKHWIDSW